MSIAVFVATGTLACAMLGAQDAPRPKVFGEVRTGTGEPWAKQEPAYC